MSYTQFIKRGVKSHKRHPQNVRPVRTAANLHGSVPQLLDYPIDTTIDSLIINDSLISAELSAAILDGKLIETTVGAASLELNIEDSNRTLVPQLLKDWVKQGPTPVLVIPAAHNKRKRVTLPVTWNEIYCTLDERDFALCQVHKSGDQFDLTFENRAIHELRRYNKPKVWQRTSNFSRAMAIKAMCDEVTTMPSGIEFFCSQLHTMQPIANAKRMPKDAQVKAMHGHGFAAKAPVTVKGKKATAQQKSYISQVLKTGESMQMPYPVLVSSIMCITQESSVAILNNPTLGMGLFSQEKYIGGQRSPWPAMDQGIAGDAKAYFDQCVKSYRANPNQKLADLVQSVQRSGAGAQYYAQWETEAKKTMELWGTSVSGGSVTFQEFNQYNFKRGTDQGPEDSWSCIQRLAKEVNWRAFMVDNTLYYEDDNTLVTSVPYDTISESTDGIDTIDYDIDTGKSVNEVTVTAHFDRWQSPPGVCIVVENSGPADGRWVVYQVERPLFSNTGTITLHLPSAALPEPSPSISSVTLKGTAYVAASGNPGVDKCYAKAKEIDGKHYPYVYAGGHSSIGVPTGGGFDCSGYVSAILNAAGWLNTPEASGGLNSWGQPGEGKIMTVWTNPNPGPTGHVFIEFKLPTPIGHCQANTSHVKPPSWGAAVVPWGGPGQADAGNRGTFFPRHWPGT
jgi:hypothetical protein